MKPTTHARTRALHRRLALTACAATATLPLAAAASDNPQSAFRNPQSGASRPNIVFIFADDHAWQALSAYGDARHLIDTPNIDRIAARGMRFDRCLVTNSLCGPSRAVVLTGAYSHINGFYDNQKGSVFDGSQITFPKLLQAAGYQTAIIGKWHLASNPTGFDFWQILVDQGKYYDPPMIRNGQKIQTTGYVSDIVTDASIEWLKHRDKTKPFLLMSHHKSTHRPWEANIPDLDFDKDPATGAPRAYAEPPTLFDDYANRGPAERVSGGITIRDDIDSNDMKLARPRDLPQRHHAQWDAHYAPLNRAYNEKQTTAATTGKNAVTSLKYQRFLHEYLATVRSLDNSVGRLLDYLEKENLLENTIIVYASDQGFFLGEHGWFDKRWFYEESIRTPLLISWPRVIKPGATNADMVSNLDFAPTFLDAAGLAIPPRMQGRSLVPLLKGDATASANWRRSFYYHFYEDAYGVPPQYGLVTDRYKLMHILNARYDYWEMFDLQKDPRELTSVYNDPAYAQERHTLETELARLRADLRVPDNARQQPTTSKKKKNPR